MNLEEPSNKTIDNISHEIGTLFYSDLYDMIDKYPFDRESKAKMFLATLEKLLFACVHHMIDREKRNTFVDTVAKNIKSNLETAIEK